MERILSFIVLLFCLCAFFFPQQKESNSTIQLGRQLFFDPVLSKDSTVACSSCHQPAFAFADSVAFSRGVGDSLGTRNTPSIMNMAFRPYFFYDGRAATLEEQILVPIESSIEMHLEIKELVRRIQNDAFYQNSFQEIYGEDPDSTNILHAIAEFIRSL